jgi:polysaccharide export outer membrane protein
MTDTPPNSTYGFEPSMDFSTPPARTSRPVSQSSVQPAPQPAYPQRAASANTFQQNLVPAPPTVYRQPGDTNTPYGYNKGDGEPSSSGRAPPPAFQPSYQGAAYNPAGASASDTDPDYVLGSGDKIHVAVFDEPDLTGDHAVDGSGFVRLPLIGEVHAAGYTTGQLEAAIGSKLANGYLRSPRVSVQVVTYRPFYVIGAVGRPGEYPFVNHMTVLNAVAMAGGFLPSAVESTVYIRPQGSAHEYRVNVDAATKIHPGDVVRVDTTFFWDTMSLFSPLNGVAAIAVAGIR